MTSLTLGSRRLLCDELIASLLGSGEHRAVLLVGPAGIGKTSLLRMVTDGLGEHRIRAVAATGSTASEGIALGPFAGVLAEMPSSAADEQSLALIRHLTGMRHRARLLVDNVDRLDPASLFVLGHFVRDARMPAVLTVREVTRLPEPVREMYDEGLVGVLDVPALEEAEAIALAASLLGGDLTPRAARTLVDRAEGNPLYIRELVVGSRSNGTLRKSDHGWEFTGLPRATPRLAQLLGAALDGLGEEDDDLVGLLAVSGGLPADLIPAEQADRLLRRGIVALDGPDVVTLGHPLFGEAVHERSTSSMLYRHRVRAIDLLAGRDDDRFLPTLAALHLAVDRRPPAELALSEARRALVLMDHVRARSLAEAVRADDPDHVEACRISGAAASGTGDLDAADRLLAFAAETAVGECQQSLTARSLAHHLSVRRHDPVRAAQTLEKVLPELTDPASRSPVEHDLLQWQMVSGLVGLMPAPPDAADDASYTHYLMLTMMVALISGPYSEAEEKNRLLEELAPRHAEEVPTGQAIARLSRFMLLSYSGDIVAAREVAERMLGSGNEHPEMLGSWEYSLGMIELLDADVARAAELAEKAVDHLRWRDPLGLLGTALALAEAAHTACGRFSAAAGYAEQIPEASQLDPKVAMLRAWAEAWREQEAGRRTHAADIIAAAARALQDLHHVFYAGMLAHCAARSGYPAKVLDVLEEAARAGGGVLDLFLAHARAIDEGDDEELARIVEEFDALGMQATAVDGAALLARRARRAGRVMEARRWEWRAHQSLPAEMDVALWLHEKRGEVQLSPREREVALFAARRLSSREIAARLGVSEKTVSNQLGSVYRKLGVSGRAELRELLEEETG